MEKVRRAELESPGDWFMSARASRTLQRACEEYDVDISEIARKALAREVLRLQRELEIAQVKKGKRNGAK